MELIKVEVKRVIGPTPSGAAILLGNEQKTFVVFVGFYEAAALIREMNGEQPARPLTHELIQSVFRGFDLEVKQIVISAIIENTFCATLTLSQQLTSPSGERTEARKEVRIDARPSDCLVLALKTRTDIFVSDEVFSQVQDVSKMTEEVESNLVAMPTAEFDIEVRAGEGSMGAPSETDDADDPADPDDADDEDDLYSVEDDDFLHDDEDDEEGPDPEGYGGARP